jgi:light-regulated signal transduction histidine kinase (bacteriophytochrome)
MAGWPSIALRTAAVFVPPGLLSAALFPVPPWWYAVVGLVSFVFACQWHRLEGAERLIGDLKARLDGNGRALAAIRHELEVFSYAVSHDLRTPLRAVDGFCQALAEDYADGLDATAMDYLGRVRRAAQRMGELIDDLLGLSRVTRAETRMQPVDLSAMARSVAAELAAIDPGRQVEWRIADGLSADADARLLRVALGHLMGNAWKFTGRTAAPVIGVGRRTTPEGEAFFVSDNGAGFDMAYAEKLFGAFQRLHGIGEYDGTGIGLATVERVVARHGGRIWVEARPGEGATFFFTLGTDAP